MPVPAVDFALAISPRAYSLDIYVLTPTPVPTASAVIINCKGYMTDNAVSPCPEYCPTKRLSTMFYSASTSCDSITGGDILSRIFQILSVPKNSALLSIWALLLTILSSKRTLGTLVVKQYMDYTSFSVQKQSKR